MEQYSILMSVYKNDDPVYLKQSIESMLRQSIPSNDFVVIEDGELTEELYSVLDDYKHNPTINRYKNEHNMGLAYSLNRGLRLCKNRLVARMDADDISVSVRCEKQLMEFQKNTDLVIVGTALLEFEQTVDNVISKKNMPETREEILAFARRRNPFNHPSVMYDKNIILDTFGGYNSKSLRAQDFELFSAIVFRGFDCININEFLLFYRTDSVQIKRRFSWRTFKSVLRIEFMNYLDKYVSLYDLLWVFGVQLLGLITPNCILQRIMRKKYRD